MERRNFLRVSVARAAGVAGAAALAAGCAEATAAGTEANGTDDGTEGGTAGGGCDVLTPIDPVEPAVIKEGEGEETDNGLMLIKVRAHNLGNYWSMMEGEVEPKQLLAPHTHQNVDQAVYVIEGELIFEFGGKGGETLEAPQGSFVVKPRGLMHTFWNPGAKTTRYIELSANRDFEHFVDASASADSLQEVEAAAAEYDVEFHYDQILRLLAENGLTSVRGVGTDPPRLDELDLPKPPPPKPG